MTVGAAEACALRDALPSATTTSPGASLPPPKYRSTTQTAEHDTEVAGAFASVLAMRE